MSKKRSSKRMNRTLNSLEVSKNHSAMQITIAPVAPRNPYANHPLMRKSAVHEKSKSAERSKTRRETKQLARDWSTHSSSLIFKYFWTDVPFRYSK
ncbi:MAG: hypothetical protein COA86_11410 [Kangiella sp.]|nr:MAG: hypothetical protein COA86_11410 [Kangiella sp.]